MPDEILGYVEPRGQLKVVHAVLIFRQPETLNMPKLFQAA